MGQGWCQAPVNKVIFDDGWIRTFGDVPEFSKEEIELLTGWLEENKLGEIMIFLTSEKYKNLSDDMSEFILRELIGGDLMPCGGKGKKGKKGKGKKK